MNYLTKLVSGCILLLILLAAREIAGSTLLPAADVLLKDHIYEETIKTVLLYPTSPEKERAARLLQQPILSLQQHKTLTLEFDDLQADYRSFRAKIIHCNADWSQSVLNDVEFTQTFNEFPVLDYQQSFSTKVPYYHYSFEVPPLKLAGNYVLLVYTERDRTPVLTRRFMIYDPKVRIEGAVRFSEGVSEQKTHQQVDFSIDYKGYVLNAPQTELKVVIRQNFRWDNLKTDFRPTSVNAFEQTAGYQFFRLENNFPGGNEFRYFDSRTLTARGFGIQYIERLDEFTRLILAMDKPRAREGYFQSDDFNGHYIIDQRESGNGSTEADYTPVVFSLKAPESDQGDVYVNGSFNLWQLNDLNRMTYNAETGTYNAVILLKQGVINYDYVVQNTDTRMTNEQLLEGTYSTTENDYDILVYHRPPAARSDILIGYRTLEWNRRR